MPNRARTCCFFDAMKFAFLEDLIDFFLFQQKLYVLTNFGRNAGVCNLSEDVEATKLARLCAKIILFFLSVLRDVSMCEHTLLWVCA